MDEIEPELDKLVIRIQSVCVNSASIEPPYFDTDCSWSLDESNNDDLIEGELFQGRYDDFSENDEMQLLLFGVRLRNLFENNE
ncbi:24523_t:CDS:2 [Entrophospora sp. SA101]|nr:24523_t:CDS:2 [Entrophospora sp. SA101]CAJ0842696.1 11689_t:CDS:2 [Entrophospora sp. SA101]CAJ0905832.1 7864_t:CDS:2 [Entrophospora sp. SA101]